MKPHAKVEIRWWEGNVNNITRANSPVPAYASQEDVALGTLDHNPRWGRSVIVGAYIAPGGDW